MESSNPTTLLTAVMSCGTHPVPVPINGGLVLATTDTPVSHHVVAIAIGVGVPGGLLLLTILVFIVFIFLSVQRLKRKRLSDDEAAEEIKSIPSDATPDPILAQSRPTSAIPPRFHLARALSTGSIPTHVCKYALSPSPQPPAYYSFDLSRPDIQPFSPSENMEISSTISTLGSEISPPRYI